MIDEAQYDPAEDMPAAQHMSSVEIDAFLLKHHTVMTRAGIARTCRISIRSVYRRLRRLGLPTVIHGNDTRNEEYEKIIIREYPHKSKREINAEYGIPTTTVWRIARRLKLQKTEKAKQRLREKEAQGRNAGLLMRQTEKARKEASEKLKRLYRKEYWRVHGGMRQKTKLRLQRVPHKTYQAIWYLVHRYGYIETTEDYLLWFDEHTERKRLRKGEAYFTKRYGIKFAPAED